jgi:hypothetical protein
MEVGVAERTAHAEEAACASVERGRTVGGVHTWDMQGIMLVANTYKVGFPRCFTVVSRALPTLFIY